MRMSRTYHHHPRNTFDKDNPRVRRHLNKSQRLAEKIQVRRDGEILPRMKSRGWITW